MRKILSMGFVACIALLTLGAVTASAAGTQNYTFTGQTSLDSGTCGNNWATDTYTRVFKVYLAVNADGSYTVVENFTGGHFVTLSGSSPGACETGTNNGNMVSANVSGSFHGSETITVVNGTYSASGAASWDGTGGTAGFITAAFGLGATYTADFYFKYTTSNKNACMKGWINSSTPGNSGDIATVCG